MAARFNELIMKPIKRFFQNSISQITEINRKYANPHLKTSKVVKIALLLLRFYLILLVGILFYKFYITVVK